MQIVDSRTAKLIAEEQKLGCEVPLNDVETVIKVAQISARLDEISGFLKDLNDVLLRRSEPHGAC